MGYKVYCEGCGKILEPTNLKEFEEGIDDHINYDHDLDKEHDFEKVKDGSIVVDIDNIH